MYWTIDKKNLLEKMFFITFFLMCYFQIFAVFFGFDFKISSYFILCNFFFALLILFKELINREIIKFFPRYMFLYLLTLVSLVSLVLFYNLTIEEKFDYKGRGSISNINSYSLGIIAWSVIGSSFYFCLDQYKSFNKNIIVIVVFTFLVFVFAARGIVPFNYFNLNQNREIGLDHLVLGSFLIYIIIYTQSLAEKYWIYPIFLLNLLILYISGGRADLFIFFISSLLYYTFFYKNKVIGVLFLIIVSLLIALFLLLNTVGLYTLQGVDRFFSIFSSTDSSGEVRSEIFRSNIIDLPNKILVGNPNYLIDQYNNLGEYIHNILSIWEFYGFIFFLLILYVISSNLKFLIINKQDISKESNGRFACFSLIFVFLSIIAAKSVFYYPFWFVLGFWFFYKSFYQVRTS